MQIKKVPPTEPEFELRLTREEFIVLVTGLGKTNATARAELREVKRLGCEPEGLGTRMYEQLSDVLGI